MSFQSSMRKWLLRSWQYLACTTAHTPCLAVPLPCLASPLPGLTYLAPRTCQHTPRAPLTLTDHGSIWQWQVAEYLNSVSAFKGKVMTTHPIASSPPPHPTWTCLHPFLAPLHLVTLATVVRHTR